MKTVFRYTVTSEDDGKRLKTVLGEQFAFSSRLMTKLRRNSAIMLNGLPMAGWVPVAEGDQIEVIMPEERSDFPPEDIPIDVVYEDDYMMVVNKQPGIVVHPTKGNPCHTLLNGIMFRMLREPRDEEKDVDVRQYKLRLVNRLDMNTSGLIIVAKNPFVQADLVKQMKTTMVKRYMALAEGIVEDDSGMIDLPLGKPDENEVERWVMPLEAGGQESVTHFKVIERFKKPHEMTFGSEAAGGPIEQKTIPGYTLLELKLDTGRTHQIRIHLSATGHPVVGDHLYCHGDPFEYRRIYGDPRPPLTGEKGPRMETNPEIISDIIDRQALHAYSLEFIHPVTGEMMNLRADLPEDMKKAIDKIR